jgi:hypothetical protein
LLVSKRFSRTLSIFENDTCALVAAILSDGIIVPWTTTLVPRYFPPNFTTAALLLAGIVNTFTAISWNDVIFIQLDLGEWVQLTLVIGGTSGTVVYRFFTIQILHKDSTGDLQSVLNSELFGIRAVYDFLYII